MADADQPIMNEVPRWDEGYEFQIFQEFQWSDDLMRGSKVLPNPENLWYEKQITHFEAVYTWHKWIRLTAKLPFVDQERRVLDGRTGTIHTQRNTGFDDVRLALPLRYYSNKPTYSGHIGVAPQIRFGGDDGAYPLSDGSTDYGVSATFERETASFKVSGDVTYWWERNSSQGNDWSIDIGVGWNFHDRGTIHCSSSTV